jgi:hypothetical protein
MRSKALGLGVLGCALALASACASKTGNKTGGSGTTGGGAATGVSSGGATGGGAGATGGTGATAGGSGGSGSGGKVGGGTGATSGSGGGGGTGATSGSGGTGGVPAMSCTGAGPAKTGACRKTAEGIYAIKTLLDVWWQDEKNQGTPIVDPGRAPMTIYLMGDLQNVCDDGSGGTGVMKACGSELPPFTSDVACDAFQLQFPDEMWDKPTMPTFNTGGSTTGFEPGSVLTLAKAIGLVGIFLDKPDGTWPMSTQTGSFACKDAMGAAKMGMDCFPDQDGDGQPGVTVKLKTGSVFKPNGCGGGNAAFTYRGSPTSVDVAAAGGTGAGVRAVEVHIGLRTVLGGSGAIAADCMSGVGDAVAEKIESRAFSCKVDPMSVPSGDTSHMNNDCSAAEATFVDDNVPNYHILQKGDKPPASGLNYPLAHTGDMLDQTPSVGPRASMVRLGDRGAKFTCVDVRAAMYPKP